MLVALLPPGVPTRHYLNPSNFGIAVTLLLFPWVGIAGPYQFTENLDVIGDWALPMVIICTGSFLNTWYTRRIPLALAWVGTFALQAIVSSLILWYYTDHFPMASRLRGHDACSPVVATSRPPPPWQRATTGGLGRRLAGTGQRRRRA